MKTNDEILAKLKFILSDLSTFSPNEIKREDTWENLALDSLDKVSACTTAERIFEITISDEAMEKIDTVGQLEDLVIELGGKC